MSTLVKAKLIAQSGGSDIEFMFNPTELSFTRNLKLNCPDGARTDDGLPKITFGAPEAMSLNLNGLIFDTYESGENILDKHIQKLCEAVEFVDGKERPPMYIFAWGKQDYLRCFVQSLTYRLTMFLPDGTPVRASVDLTLQQIGETTSSGKAGPPSRR